MAVLIKCENLRKVYNPGGSEVVALGGVDLVIEKGEFVAIMGPSGSGKSTLMHILGLLDRPDGGKYFLLGEDTGLFDDETAAAWRGQRMGFVFQAFNLLADLTVAENVALPLWYDRRRRSGAEKKRRVEEVLKAVGMFARREHRPAQLSGGERQRAAIARALINDPEIIFADEPTGNLDSVAGANIMRILRTLNDEGRTIVLVTHERQTARAASRILRMKDGSLAGDEAVEDRLSFSNEKEVSLK